MITDGTARRRERVGVLSREYCFPPDREGLFTSLESTMNRSRLLLVKRFLIRSSSGEVEERKSLIVKHFIRFPSRQQV